MQRGHPGDFGYRSNWQNSFHDVSVPSTETDSNLNSPHQGNKMDDLEFPTKALQFLQRVD